MVYKGYLRVEGHKGEQTVAAKTMHSRSISSILKHEDGKIKRGCLLYHSYLQ